MKRCTMNKIWLSAVLGAVALLALPGISSAQRVRQGGRGYYGGGRSYSGYGGYRSYSPRNYAGYGRGYYGGNGRGYYGGLSGLGLGLYLGSLGSGYGYPYSSGYGYPSSYGYGYPSYGGSYTYAPSYNYVQPSYSYAQPSVIAPSSYEAPATTSPAVTADDANPNAAMLELRVPPNAEVWIGGVLTSQTGTVRHYTSPTIERDRTFTYQIRARWTDDNGEVVDRTKQVKVWAGARIGVDFNNP